MNKQFWYWIIEFDIIKDNLYSGTEILNKKKKKLRDASFWSEIIENVLGRFDMKTDIF